ncbi:hypothetical protein ACFLVI_02420 [Chloroflexota bacterium]
MPTETMNPKPTITLPAIPSTTPTPAPKPTPKPTPIPTPTPAPTPIWTIPVGDGTSWRALHMGGNWGTTRDAVNTMPEEYFEYVRDLNVNWVGISIALHVDGSMDSTVELQYSGTQIPTFSDEVIIELVRAFRQHGFNVYFHIAFEGTGSGAYPFQRWQLGDPHAPDWDPDLLPEYWPWTPPHQDHQQFVAEFWQTYTEQLVHIAQIAETEGVGLLTLGTETDRLFRSRSGGIWSNHFKNEMTAMVSAVRTVYSGLLGYEMHGNALVDRNYFGAGSDYLVADLDLDVICVSAYFQLANVQQNRVMSVQEFEAAWNVIFEQHLVPLKQRNGDRSIIFTEFGYVDSVGSPYLASHDEFQNKLFRDKNENGLDDGEETQANCYEAFFNVMDSKPGVLEGAFLWGHQMATETQYAQSFAQMRTFSTRGKMAEAIVRARYEQWR